MDAWIPSLYFLPFVWADAIVDDRSHYLTAQDTFLKSTVNGCGDVSMGIDLPIWSWCDGSCALDSALMALVTIATRLKHEFIAFAACGNFVNRQIAIEIDRWGQNLSPPWSWARSTPGAMNNLRNTIRALLLDSQFVDLQIEINHHTPIDQRLQNVLFPPELFEWSCAIKLRCLRCDSTVTRSALRGERGLSTIIRSDRVDERDVQAIIDRKVIISATSK